MADPAFVIGTGRCGSTMLSNMLRRHPHILSLSEFFIMAADGGTRFAEMFSAEPVDGSAFWDLFSTISPFGKFQRNHRIAPREHIYNCDRPGARFTWDTGVPPILVATLPHLTDEPDDLYDELEREVAGWPRQTMNEHYRHLFAVLAARFGKRQWVERSGASLLMVELLAANFPDARFIHVVREGRDTAMSMQEHLAFRLIFLMNLLGKHLEVNPIKSADRTHIDRVPADLLPYLPETFDAKAFHAYRVPVELCGEVWTQQILRGAGVLETIPSDRLLTVRYEDFLADAKHHLDILTSFLGDDLVDEAWSANCAATIRKPQSNWRNLPSDSASALAAACQPGLDRLAAMGVRYET